MVSSVVLLLSKKLDGESPFRHTAWVSGAETKCVCCGSVPTWCVFCCQVIRLSHWPLLRDSVYYTLSISALIVVRRRCLTWMSVIRACFPFLMFFSTFLPFCCSSYMMKRLFGKSRFRNTFIYWLHFQSFTVSSTYFAGGKLSPWFWCTSSTFWLWSESQR